MTIDEAIAHAKEVAKGKMTEYESHYDKDAHYYPRQCKRCAEEHGQLAEWLEELEQYRAIGTVDRFRQLAEQFRQNITDETSCPERSCNKCDKYRKENEKYHKIGTVEECRIAMEKQTAKIADLSGDGYADGHMVYDTYECPNCGEHYELDYDEYEYCPNCGQHMKIELEGDGNE